MPATGPAKWYSDPELIHHRHEAALIRAQLEDLLADNEGGGTPRLWKRLKGTHQANSEVSRYSRVF